MRIARFEYKNKERWGVLQDGTARLLIASAFEKIALSGEKISEERIKLLPPALGGKIILAGLNYRDHARELGMKIPKEPVIFLKPQTALIAHEGNISYPHGVKRLDYEAELALVIKKQGRNIPEKKVNEYILGYTCLNDITARDLQKKDGQWTRAKSFDTFCPVGPWLETDVNPSRLNIRAYLNGKLKQDSSTEQFIFSVPYLVSFISRVMTLMPGDIISTGTPPGIGRMERGDCVEVFVEGIGTLRNFVSKKR